MATSCQDPCSYPGNGKKLSFSVVSDSPLLLTLLMVSGREGNEWLKFNILEYDMAIKCIFIASLVILLSI